MIGLSVSRRSVVDEFGTKTCETEQSCYGNHADTIGEISYQSLEDFLRFVRRASFLEYRDDQDLDEIQSTRNFSSSLYYLFPWSYIKEIDLVFELVQFEELSQHNMLKEDVKLSFWFTGQTNFILSGTMHSLKDPENLVYSIRNFFHTGISLANGSVNHFFSCKHLNIIHFFSEYESCLYCNMSDADGQWSIIVYLSLFWFVCAVILCHRY